VLRQQVMLRLAKTQGMGLSIVAAKGVGKDRLGIYIKVIFYFYSNILSVPCPLHS
jgi:hypothetical protein